MNILKSVVSAFSGAEVSSSAIPFAATKPALRGAVPTLIKNIGDSFEVDVLIARQGGTSAPHSFVGFDLTYPVAVIDPSASPQYVVGSVYQGHESDTVVSLSQISGVNCLAVSHVLKQQTNAVDAEGLVVTLKFTVIGQGSGFCELKNRKIGRVVEGVQQQHETSNIPFAVDIEQPSEPVDSTYLFYIEVR